jgi:hypothetical protein
MVKPRSVRIIALFALVLVFGCSDGSPALAPAEPKTLAPGEVSKIAAALPSYAHFSVSGVAFLGDRLFVATNIGLIEVQDRAVKALYRWYDKFNVISGPWSDVKRGALWAHRADDGYFVRRDKNGWQRIDLPKPPKGYYSRGDMLQGFVGVSDTDSFRLIGAGAVWQWGTSGEWVLDPAPPAEKFSAVVAFGRAGTRTVNIVRKGICALRPCNYLAYWRENERWLEPVTIPTGQTRDTISSKDGVFLRGGGGELFRLDVTAAILLKTPGPCEAITLTSDGKLLASFRGAGIYEFSSGWIKLLDDPYTQTEGEHWAYLAESNGSVALGTASVPHLKPGTDNQWSYSGTDALWVSQDKKLVRVVLTE